MGKPSQSSNQSFDSLVDDSQTYGSTGQQVLAGVEGIGQGLAGPIATAAEAGLTKLGVPGLSPHEQELRATNNPVTHIGSEAAGFGAGVATGTGEAAVLSKIGEGVVGASRFAGATSTAGKIAGAALRGSAELAALQAGNEISKTINQDPGQSIGSAAINIGLSGILGGTGGAALGTMSSLARGSLGKVDEFLQDYQSRMDIQGTEDLAKAATPGAKFADWATEKGADTIASAAGRGLSGTLGGLAGSLVGHPIAGAYAAERVLGPVFSHLAKPFAEGVVNGEGARVAVDYIANAVKGELVMNSAVKGLFQSAEVLPKNLLPSDDSRDRLERSLNTMQNPDNIMKVGGSLAHYMPDHSVAAASTAAQAVQYLSALKPRPAPTSPFDATPPVDKGKQAKYFRALDIAQQPLMVLQYAKQGSLTNQDVQSIQAMYPNLHGALVSKINDQLIEHAASGKQVPYSQRLALARLTGTPLDSSMRQPNMAGIIMSQQQGTLESQGQPQGGKATAVELKQINKVNSLDATAPQNRAIQRRSK